MFKYKQTEEQLLECLFHWTSVVKKILAFCADLICELESLHYSGFFEYFDDWLLLLLKIIINFDHPFGVEASGHSI